MEQWQPGYGIYRLIDKSESFVTLNSVILKRWLIEVNGINGVSR